jgi:hypothetical protein
MTLKSPMKAPSYLECRSFGIFEWASQGQLLQAERMTRRNRSSGDGDNRKCGVNSPRDSASFDVTASLRPYTENDWPHPQVDFAFGFLIVNPPPVPAGAGPLFVNPIRVQDRVDRPVRSDTRLATVTVSTGEEPRADHATIPGRYRFAHFAVITK